MALEFEDSIITLEEKLKELKANSEKEGGKDSQCRREIAKLEEELIRVKKDVYSKLTPWQCVQIARDKDRPIIHDYISLMFSEFIELHGDRNFGDDRALIGGLATIDNQKVMLIGFNKGRGVDDKVKSNFGMSHPEGYRKALRLMRIAEKYRLPIICLVDTPAAFPGAAAEERGQAEAIARNLTEMSSVIVPIIVVITGEGGSGGALGLGVGDVIIMLSNAIYSVIPPEGCAAILWRDSNKAPEAASALKITAPELKKLGVIDEIIQEPLGGAHRDHATTAALLKKSLLKHIQALRRLNSRKLLARRFEKYTRIGRYAD